MGNQPQKRPPRTRERGHVGIYLGVAVIRDVDALAAALGLSFSATVRRLLLPSITLEQLLESSRAKEND